MHHLNFTKITILHALARSGDGPAQPPAGASRRCEWNLALRQVYLDRLDTLSCTELTFVGTVVAWTAPTVEFLQ